MVSDIASPFPSEAGIDPAVEVARIITELQAGGSGEEGFRRLYAIFHRRVLAFFAHRGLSPDDCLDLTQETFLGIYRGVGAFRGEARFETWLFTVATNVYRKRQRFRGTSKRSGEELPIEAIERRPPDLPQPVADVVGEPHARLLAEERARLLREAVERLPEQMRRCLMMRLHDDLKYREIAGALRLSVDTVKAHLFQARRRLYEELGDYFLAPADDDQDEEAR